VPNPCFKADVRKSVRPATQRQCDRNISYNSVAMTATDPTTWTDSRVAPVDDRYAGGGCRSARTGPRSGTGSVEV
jgi:hypothetical protein